DSIGAIPYIIQDLNVPIYGSRLTIALIKERLKEKNVKKKVKFYAINNESVVKFGQTNVEFFETSHSIPDSYGVSLNTPYGAIVYTGELTLDKKITGNYRYNMAKRYKIGEKNKTLALISNSTEAKKKGYNTAENIIEEHILDNFQKANKRIIVSCYASNFVRIQQVL